MLGRWRHELNHQGNKAFSGEGTPRDEALAALKRELARVKKERDFLREAATYFAKESKYNTNHIKFSYVSPVPRAKTSYASILCGEVLPSFDSDA